jgi:2Fe-2S ferredoxin
MPNIIYILPDGSEQIVDVPCGQSVMDGAVRNNLPGIVAECGGSCSCATCHVFVDDSAAGLFEQATSEEQGLIEFLDDATPFSRLSCQLIISSTTAGARIRVSKSNG